MAVRGSIPPPDPSAVDFCGSRLTIGAVTERARALAMPAGTRAQALQTRHQRRRACFTAGRLPRLARKGALAALAPRRKKFSHFRPPGGAPPPHNTPLLVGPRAVWLPRVGAALTPLRRFPLLSLPPAPPPSSSLPPAPPPSKNSPKKKTQRPPASANFARRASRHSRTFRSTTAAAMPALC